MKEQKISGEIVVNNHVIQITHVNKVLWKEKNITKIEYLNYLQAMVDYMLPFLKQRPLTTIRFPNGIHQQSFYQKNCPTYAPSFVPTFPLNDINYILCNNLETLLWMGNQGTIEFHVPFAKKNNDYPSEIVFDLDPPSRNEFSLAVEASLIIKEALQKLRIPSYIKTSGNKGLQVYVPNNDSSITFSDTRYFTAFIAQFLIEKEPKWFTTERLKEKRNNRLYVDYVQHSEGKTIIAPYSLRGNKDALVATPLFWSEVSAKLRPEHFPMEAINERIAQKGCPFSDFYKRGASDSLKPIIAQLKEK